MHRQKLDWTYSVPNNQFAWLQKYYAPELVISPWLGSYFFGFNLGREPFIENQPLRRALVLAIDRAVLTEKVTQYGEQPSFALIPGGIGDYAPAIPEYAAWTQEESVAEARRLYREAGYSTKKPLAIELRNSSSENNKKIALAVASMWKQVLGVRSTLVNEEWKVFLGLCKKSLAASPKKWTEMGKGIFEPSPAASQRVGSRAACLVGYRERSLL